MEKYKKKSLNFMGYSRDLRKIERDTQRCVSRLKRFSVIRPLDDESITEEQKEENSRIPAIGKPKVQAGSRVELLQKWKQEKMVKKQQESKLRKPAFKVGVIKPNPSPSVGNKPLFALDTSSRLFKSSFQVSNSQLFGKKQESLVASNVKTTMKVSNSQSSAKKTDVATDNLKTSTKDMKIQPSKSKIGIASKPESKWTKNKESCIQSISVKPKVDVSSKAVNKDQLSGSKKQPTIASKPLETKKESRLQPLNTRSKVISTAKGAKSNIPSTGLPKPTTSRTLNKVPDQKQIPKSNAFKIPERITYDKHIPGKNNVKSIPKFSKTVASQQKGNISGKTPTSESKVPNKPVDDFATFECELSHIEPVKEQKKSFAPKGFMFQPPAELSSSLFLEDGPSAIFLRMRNQFLRTSTPKQSPSDQKSSAEIKDIEGLQNEDAECLKNENNECSRNTDKEFEPATKHDLETLLSSSLGSVSLNDTKPIDCKQSLKFESPEVISTQNQEEMLLSSKIIHPEHSLATEPLTGAINPPILSDSVEIDKSKINSIDISSTRAINPPILPDTVEIDKTEKNSIDIISTGAINPPILPDTVEIDKIEINSTDIGPTGAQNLQILPDSMEMDKTNINSTDISPIGAANPPILLDLAEIDKTEINSTDTSPADNSQIAVPFPEVDSVFSEGKEVPEGNQFVLNGFLQKQENDPVKIPIKFRNFRGSEKPGLMSINESLENTPKSALKKKVLESDFTPRRSLRLAKLSGNFSSLDNLLDYSEPKDQDKSSLKGSFTPRRSTRLSKFSTEFNSAENLFDVRRPTLYGTPEKDQPVPKLFSKVTYDFDRLSSEMEEETRLRTKSFGKVSLLPISRTSIMRHSIKGDLMSFSPEV